ncbi:CarD family transcriptional regulator [Peptoniphilus catoniae]|uniref:CarD family transcriptional regulator n=1 Tax=Peptoniphilus catoniae TaxID=1660341 RepID=UPI0010FDC8D0|nr:CarD family transcriptional regulator [Peptoniphilus catoniae]
MYKIGDRVVYPMHGAGVIVGIEDKKILGKIKKYYIMKMPIKEMKVMVPVDNVAEIGLRDILGTEDMDEVLKILSGEDNVKMPTNWNRRYRFNMDRIKTGNIKEIARVVRFLERIDQEKSLSTGERKMLTGAKQIIISEMSLVYDKDVDEITKMVEDAVFNV